MEFIGKHLKMMNVCFKDFFIFFSPVTNRLMFWPVNAVKRWKRARALTNRTALNIHNSQRTQRQESFAHFKTFWQHLIEMFTANFLNEQGMFYCKKYLDNFLYSWKSRNFRIQHSNNFLFSPEMNRNSCFRHCCCCVENFQTSCSGRRTNQRQVTPVTIIMSSRDLSSWSGLAAT